MVPFSSGWEMVWSKANSFIASSGDAEWRLSAVSVRVRSSALDPSGVESGPANAMISHCVNSSR